MNKGSIILSIFLKKFLSTLESQKEIKVCDRATLFNLLIGLNGYTICSGVINEQLNGKDIISVPLDVDDYMEIGYITHNKAVLGRFGQYYIGILKEYTKRFIRIFFSFEREFFKIHFKINSLQFHFHKFSLRDNIQ